MTVRLAGISKKFNRRAVFSDVGFHVDPGEVFGIVGRNGSGKSTLLRIVGGLLTPSTGTISYELAGVQVDRDRLFSHVGYVAPYLTLFEEFSAEENIRIFAEMRGMARSSYDPGELLRGVGLPDDRRDPIRAFSSGMKQRMKMIFAVMHRPPLLLLDEPISNLDSEGVASVYSIVDAFREHGSVIIATNDDSDIARCDRTYTVNSNELVDRRAGGQA